ncbi:MAG TPA: transposase [Fibrobacteria bacterium]|nr:transposase [Fibrobacteria bacterium]
MRYDRPIPGRISYRLRGHDYTAPGIYYITICTHDRECLFGHIANGRLIPNIHGDIVREEWIGTPDIRPEIRLDEFVVMPNHLHAIIWIAENVPDSADAESGGAHGCAPNEHNTHAEAHDRAPNVYDARKGAHSRAPLRRTNRSLGSFIAGFKSIVTKRINIARGTPGIPVWQRNYYERVVRDEQALRTIRRYIRDNPANWGRKR